MWTHFPIHIKLTFLFMSTIVLGRIPVRLYLWTVNDDFDDFEDAPQIDNWDKVSYFNRPVEIHKEDGKSCLIKILHKAFKLNIFHVCLMFFLLSEKCIW